MATRREYSDDFKAKAVAEIRENSIKPAALGTRLGINPNLLSRWMKEGWGTGTVVKVSNSKKAKAARAGNGHAVAISNGNGHANGIDHAADVYVPEKSHRQFKEIILLKERIARLEDEKRTLVKTVALMASMAAAAV